MILSECEYVLFYSRYGALFLTPFHKGFKSRAFAEKEQEHLISSGVDFVWIYLRSF